MSPLQQTTQQTPVPHTQITFGMAFERLIGHEGGYTDDRRDRGNWTSGVIGKGELKGTKFGISAMSYPDLDIRNLTLDQAKAIYRRDFWDCYRMDELPATLWFELFDAGVNHGPPRAAMFLQCAVGVADDGDIGPITLAAVGQYSPERLEMRFNAERLDFYTRLNAWDTYSRGWARRVAENLRTI